MSRNSLLNSWAAMIGNCTGASSYGRSITAACCYYRTSFPAADRVTNGLDWDGQCSPHFSSPKSRWSCVHGHMTRLPLQQAQRQAGQPQLPVIFYFSRSISVHFLSSSQLTFSVSVITRERRTANTLKSVSVWTAAQHHSRYSSQSDLLSLRKNVHILSDIKLCK